VTFNLYANPSEALALVDQFNKTRQVFASLAAKGLFFFETRPGFSTVPPTATATEILGYLTTVVGAEGHAVGTCSLGKVVDERLNLIDGIGNIIPGVTIADNSIIPKLLSTHGTSGSAMLVGARAATLILEEDSKKRSFFDDWID
jgi:choline dehydrogenase-like flavoprotein